MLRVAFIGRSHEFSLVPAIALAQRFQLVGIIEDVGSPASSTVRRIARRLREEAIAERLFSKSPRPRRLRSLAARHRASYYRLEARTREGLGDFLRAAAPDVVCVASLHWLIRRDELGIPRFGFINLHPSRLPDYHGPMPWFWQYHDFVREIGVSIHQIDLGQDTGAILNQASIVLPLGAEIEEAISLVAPLGAQLMVETVTQMAEGRLVPTPQDITGHDKARKIGAEECFIDWHRWPSERIWHFMRGTRGWHRPLTYPTHLGSNPRIGRLVDASVFGGTIPSAPGQLFQVAGRDYVALKDGAIEIGSAVPAHQR